jgi:type I restriction enzyme S subunit
MKLNYKRLGNYINQIDVRNSKLAVPYLRGVSTTKELIKSVANLSGLEFSGYKIVENGQFVYVSDTSRRGDKIALAMN